MTVPSQGNMPVHHCPTCGLDTPALDPLDCPGCGTFLDWPVRPETPRQRRRRIRAALSPADQDFLDAERYAVTKMILSSPAVRRSQSADKERGDSRATVHRHRHVSGKTIGQTELATGFKRRYVIELSGELEPTCTEECRTRLAGK